MRILIAPNAFRDCLDAARVAKAMAKGAALGWPSAEMTLMPLSDGGDGLLDALAGLPEMAWRRTRAPDPLGRMVEARYLFDKVRDCAVVEMAEISGLNRLAVRERNPLRATTRGTGVLIRAALDAGARRIVVGVGGSATMDAGAGALTELGVRFLDSEKRPLHPSPCELVNLAEVDLSNLDERLAGTELILFCDVRTPLRDSLEMFGGQKGARPEDYATYRKSYAALAAKGVERGFAMFETPFLGAGGGLAAGLTAFAGAKPESGAEALSEMLGLENEIRHADLVLTGEGRLDQGSLDGKLPVHVARLAERHGRACLVLTGQVGEGVWSRLPETACVFSIVDGPQDRGTAINRAESLLVRHCEQLVRFFKTAQTLFNQTR